MLKIILLKFLIAAISGWVILNLLRYATFRLSPRSAFSRGLWVYVVNRWLVKPFVHTGFFHSYFNDLWLIPCALPLILWLHRQLGLRTHDRPPQLSEILPHLLFWSALFEWLGPQFVLHTTGDPLDVLMYTIGATLAGFWWQRERWLPVLFSRS